MRCIGCDNDISSNEPNCPHCGTSREVNLAMNKDKNIHTEDAQKQTSFCKKCGVPIPFGYQMCPECIAKFNRVSDTPRDRRRSGSSSLTTLLTVMIVITVFLFILGVSGVAMWRMGVFDETLSDDSVTTTTTTSNQSSTEASSGNAESPQPAPEPVVKQKTYAANVPGYIISWSEAESAARSQGGRLACPTTEEEFNRICAEAKQKGLYVIWLGGYRSSGQSWDSVSWYNGAPMNFIKWYNGKPSYWDGDREELYLMALYKKDAGTWWVNDAPNDIRYAYPSSYTYRVGYVLEKEE